MKICKYFDGMPASSISVERFFTKFGIVYTDMRKSMSPTILTMFLFCMWNLECFGSKVWSKFEVK